MTADLAKPPALEPEMYRDWGGETAFSLKLGRGECAGQRSRRRQMRRLAMPRPQQRRSSGPSIAGKLAAATAWPCLFSFSPGT